MENEVETGEVVYPGIVDQKTLSACLGTAEQLMRESTPERVERFNRTKARLIAQVKAHPLSFDKWNTRATPSPLTPEEAKERAPSYIVNCQKCGAVVELFPSTPSSSAEIARLRGALEVAQRFIGGTQLEYAVINYPDKPERTLGRFIREVLITTAPEERKS